MTDIPVISTSLLLIEDNPGDARLIEIYLDSDARVSYQIYKAVTLAEGIACYKDHVPVDTILLDLSLPDSTGLETIDRMLEGAPEAAVIVLTGLQDQELAIQAMARGAQDYLLKDDIDEVLLKRSIRYAIERKKYAIRLKEALEYAEEMAHLKTVFLANMSHEIRTPLTAIMGYAEILEDEVAWEHRVMVHLIGRSGKRLLHMLNALLDLSMLETRSFKGHVSYTCINDLIQRQVDQIREAAQEKGLLLEVMLPAFPLKGYLDVPCFERILAHLLDNAVKFTKEGGVHIKVKQQDDALQVHIRDTGIGIDPTFLPSLFEPFKQQSEGPARHYEGAGVGLTITKHLIDLMGGTITVQSAVGEGSCFQVMLPLQSLASQMETKHKSATLHQDRPALNRAHILVVEDHQETRKLYTILLQAYRLTMVATPEEAYQIAETERFDLVIMDINLGGHQSGTDVMRVLKETGRFDEVPFIAVTALALPGDRKDLLDAGFNAYVSKPFRILAFKRVIAEQLPLLTTAS